MDWEKRARIELRGPCGGSGKVAFVVSARKDRPIRVTVRKFRAASLESNRPNAGQWDNVHVIPAGGEARLGCTDANDAIFIYQIVGCKVL